MDNVTNLNYCTETEQCSRYNNAMANASGNNNSSSTSNGNNDGISGITNNITDESRRHNSMDRLMGLFNDMGRTQRTRSLSDGGKDEGNFFNLNAQTPIY